MPSADNAAIEEKLDLMILLLKHLVVLQLAERGVSHQVIAKHVRLAKATVGAMLKGARAHD